MKKAARGTVKYETDIFYPARQQFADGCEAVLYTVRWLSAGAAMRLLFTERHETGIQNAARQRFAGSCVCEADVLFPMRQLSGSGRQTAVSR